MTTKRIEELQKKTAYPDSLSVYNALMQVWNECEQKTDLRNQLLPFAGWLFGNMDKEIEESIVDDYLKELSNEKDSME